MTAPKGWHSRGYLPHLDAAGTAQHIVFRLADSLPSTVLERLDATKADARTRIQAVDATLDQGLGSRHLLDPRVAQIVQTALLHFDSERYRLIAWCIMPNHVHIVVETMPGYALGEIIHSWKSYTANRANRLLSRKGGFWAADYFDRFMRDDEHLARTVAYVEANPVSAGLCRNPTDWLYGGAAMRGVQSSQ